MFNWRGRSFCDLSMIGDSCAWELTLELKKVVVVVDLEPRDVKKPQKGFGCCQPDRVLRCYNLSGSSEVLEKHECACLNICVESYGT